MELIKIKISRYPNLLCGIKLYETEELLYIINNPVDYVLDGVFIINKKYIKRYFIDEKNELKTKILQEKAKSHITNPNIYTNSIESFIHSIYNNGSLIELGLESQEYSLIGKISDIDKKYFTLNLLSVKAVFMRYEKIALDKIRILAIETDYLNSLSIVI